MQIRLLNIFLVTAAVWAAEGGAQTSLLSARNRQDRAALERMGSSRLKAAAMQARNGALQYEAAQAQSYLSEVALELRDKKMARAAAEAGIGAARAAVSIDPNNAEYHRVLGTLCGQVIPADPMAGLQHGRCAKEEIETALKLNPKSALSWVSSGVGKFYLPAMFGGGVDLALKDFQKAAQLDPKLDEAWLWIGLAHRKSQRHAEARQAFQKALALNPERVWTRQQLEKTPAP
jgi:tetratricopeptide (TPR) repeat protein